MPKPIIIGSDHAGFRLKAAVVSYLSNVHYKVVDLGPYEYEELDDYPDYAVKVCRRVLQTKGMGILICGTGQGMDRVANKVYGIRASVAWDEFSAHVAKEHGDVNILCLGGRTTTLRTAQKILGIWLSSKKSIAARHVRRRKKIDSVERSYLKK